MLDLMNVVIAGGSGFLGSALARALAAEGHEVAILTRQAANAPSQPTHVSMVSWTPDGNSGPWARVVDGATAVINRRDPCRQALVTCPEQKLPTAPAGYPKPYLAIGRRR